MRTQTEMTCKGINRDGMQSAPASQKHSVKNVEKHPATPNSPKYVGGNGEHDMNFWLKTASE